MEVQTFVKAPVPMVACSALVTLSVATQGHVDVQRAAKLIGPASIFTLGLADSGERKTSSDGFFVTPIREYEAREAARLDPEVKAYRAALSIWAAKRDGLREAIKAGAKSGKDTTRKESELHTIEQSPPIAPRVPKILHGDETPENLAWSLAREWASAAIVSSEAGLILGSHGMGRESIMRNLAQLNVLWDGGELSIGRRTTESFKVHGARLTMALQIQEPTLRAFFDGSKGLARGTGFLARFLIYWPASTQGTRKFTEAPSTWPALSEYHRRIEALLDTPLPIDDCGALTPSLLTLSPDAKTVWVAFHDGVEEELRAGGDLADVRDVASKAADNAVRLAALFHTLERGIGGQIQANHMSAAARVAAWHLSEAQRFFGELAQPLPISDAIRIERFLLDCCRRNGTGIVPRRDAQQFGPVRDGKRLDDALTELAESNRVRSVARDRRKLLLVNPALLTGMEP
ncbi:MAG: DUF3987 domain-containing protein [Alphaproteobacteria bacterium]|nr:DUF3987 domain-containing protein [Alphaproteobacteria bacterium]